MNESIALKRKLLLASRLKNDVSLTAKLSDNSTDLKKWAFDRDILKFLFDKNVDILPVDKIINPNEFIFKLENTSNITDFLKYVNEANAYVNKKEKALLERNFENEKPIVLSRITEDIVLGNKRFLKTKREAVRRYNDESVWYLYVAAFFLKGKAIDGTTINAPLLLYKVDVIEQNGQILIVKKEAKPIINAKLNLFLNQTYDLNIKELDFDDFQTLINSYNPVLKNILNKNLDEVIVKNQIVDFNEISISENFSIEPSAIFGLMDPYGGIVLADYEKIVKSDVDPFKELSVISNANQYKEEVIDKDDIVMFGRPLNIYQKYAVKSALNESTLVFGPPGTGKSQVISDLIANIVNNSKTVLMVSEKKAALDVLEERLGALEDICLFAYDEHDTDYFYGKIKKLHELLNNQLNEIEIPNSQISYDKIKNFYEDLKNIKNIVINNKQINEINFITENNFKFPLDLVIWSANILISSKEVNLNLIFQQYNDTFNRILTKQDKFPETLLRSEFLSLVDLANRSRNSSAVYENYFVNHKIKKPSIFAKIGLKHHTKNELDSLIEIIQAFLNTGIEKISLEEIQKIVELNPNDLLRLQDEAESYLFLKEVDKIGYLSKPLLDSIATNYFLNQKRICKNIDLIIRDNYLNNIRNWIKQVEESNDTDTQNQLKELFRIASLKKSKSVNSTIKTYYNLLRKLFPIWILNPIQTSQVIPCEPEIFDYGIFDEASQMFYENSYPLVYRVKNTVVSGDDKQLSPIGNFVSKAFDDFDQYDNDSNIVSLFEKASTLSWPHFQLKNHYRSWSSELIKFANVNIYDDEMQIITINNYFKNAVNVIDVNGILKEDLTNDQETNRILNIIKNKYENNKDYMSCSTLVVGMNNQQADYIESLFNSELATICEPALIAYKNGNLTFGTIENIQGLEADDVIVSLTYAKDSNGQLNTDFGSMASDSGINRLNVAITRAVKKMTIVKSLSAKDLVSGTNNNLNMFFKFILWCDKVSSYQSLEDILFKISDTNAEFLQEDENKDEVFDTPFANDVLKTLKTMIVNENIKLVYNVSLGSRVIDICVVDVQKEKVLLCITLDDNRYIYGLRLLIEELDGQKLLQDRGYKTIRIMMIDWKLRKQVILNEIKSLLTNNN